MKEKIFNRIKNIKQRPLATNKIILSAMFFIAISLSLKNDGLFLKELALLVFIVLFAILGAQSKNLNNRNW